MAEKENLNIDDVAERLAAAREYLHIEDSKAELVNLDHKAAQPGFWDDAAAAQEVSKKASNLRDTLNAYDVACGLLDDARAADELASEDEGFAAEVQMCLSRLDSMLDQFEIDSWFADDLDSSDAIVSVNPGQGGLEAQDWTDMLYRMYSRYVEKKGWKLKVLDVVPGEGIGLDRAVFQVEGKNAYGMLRSEHGVHRLVRISPTDVRQCGGHARDVRRHRGEFEPERRARRRIPLERSRRPVREHHRFGRATHAYSHGYRRYLPKREKPAYEQGICV